LNNLIYPNDASNLFFFALSGWKPRRCSYDYLFYVSMWLKIPALKTKKPNQIGLGLKLFTSTEMVFIILEVDRSNLIQRIDFRLWRCSPFTRIVQGWLSQVWIIITFACESGYTPGPFRLLVLDHSAAKIPISM